MLYRCCNDFLDWFLCLYFLNFRYFLYILFSKKVLEIDFSFFLLKDICKCLFSFEVNIGRVYICYILVVNGVVSFIRDIYLDVIKKLEVDYYSFLF